MSCTECDYKSTWKRNIRRHIERVHLGLKCPEKEEQPMQCPECPYIGRRKRYLQKHMANLHIPKHQLRNEYTKTKLDDKKLHKVLQELDEHPLLYQYEIKQG